MVSLQEKIRYLACTIFTIIILGVGIYEFFYDKTQNPVLLTYLMLGTVCLFSFKWFSKGLAWIGLILYNLFIRLKETIIKIYGGRTNKNRALRRVVIPSKKDLNSASKKVFFTGLFISLTSSLSVLASRCYLDIAFGGSWIEYFREHAGKFPNVQLHRFIDFIYHYLPFIVISSLLFVYYDDLKKFMKKSSHFVLVIPILVSLITFMAWAWAYDLKEIYYAHNIQDWHVGMVIICVGLFMIVPFQLFLKEEEIQKTKRFYDLTFMLLSFTHMLMGFFVFKWVTLFNSLIFWSSLCAFGFSVFKLVYLGEKKTLYAAIFTTSFVYSAFFITEIYLWSLGGSHNLFYDMVLLQPFIDPKTLYFIHKGMFYVVIIYFVTMGYIRIINEFLQKNKSFSSQNRKTMYKISSIVVLFYAFWGLFKNPKFYDVALTDQDGLLFLLISFIICFFAFRPILLFPRNKIHTNS